jgi:hypothetical protein
MTWLQAAARSVAVLVFACVLNACGGGGGGDGGSGGGSGGGGGSSTGAFTIDKTSASFTALKDLQRPSGQSIALTITGTGVAQVGAAFPASQGVPQWLIVNINGTAPNFTVFLDISTTSMAPGHYTATLLLGTADAGNNVLQSKEVAVSYDVQASITAGLSVTDTQLVFGSSVTSVPATLNIDAPGKTYTVTTFSPLLTGIPAGTQTGSQNLNLNFDASTLGLGSTSAHITVQNTAIPLDRRELDIRVTLVAPTPALSVIAAVFGGTDGLSTTKTQDVDVSIDTGTNTYPWTLTLSDTQTLGWLESTAVSGLLGGAQHAAFTLGMDRSRVHPGHYTGLARFAVTVKGMVFTSDIPVTLNWESHRLYPMYDGVALSKFPSRQRLTRTIRIASSRNEAGIPWAATSDASWLHVTASGTTDDPGVQLTADPNDATAQSDAVNVATVALTSTEETIERSETIRVGFWKSAADPTDLDVTLPARSTGLAVNPVEPYAYAADDAGNVRVFNIYTGDPVMTIPPSFPGAHVDAITVSSDGQLLFLGDESGRQTFARNAATGAATGAIYQTNGISPHTFTPNGLVYTRPNGHPILWTAIGEVFDLEKGTPLQLLFNGTHLFPGDLSDQRRTVSPDSSMLVQTSSIGTTGSLDRYTQRFTVLAERGMEFRQTGASGSGGGQEGWDMCINGSGTRLVSLASTRLFRTDTPFQLTALPGLETPAGSATAVACTWDDRIYVGLTFQSTGPNNLFIFDSTGNQTGMGLSGPDESFRYARQLSVSSDLTRTITTQIQGAQITSLSLYNVP